VGIWSVVPALPKQQHAVVHIIHPSSSVAQANTAICNVQRHESSGFAALTNGQLLDAGLGCIGGIWTAPPASTAKFWLDEILWSQGRVAVELMEQVFIEAGGVRAGGRSSCS
jgi:hypothetical protein